ncbi:hypothetical protein lerEdw1_012907 [Lerista edwardsae]|nr:hypothetical protein lerEdw1_012907 [Lerista edwardsae]
MQLCSMSKVCESFNEMLSSGTESEGIILLGDSAGAHFHIPPEWLTPTQMSVEAFANLPMAISNELDWPQFSSTTGFLNSTIGGWTDSVYLYLLRRNLCNHRDYQNIAKNGTFISFVMHTCACPMLGIARNQQNDKPAIVIYEMIGNDVCNGYSDTVKHMTQPEEMCSNTIQTLQYLDTQLPKGSHVLLIGLADGRFIWDNLHDRYHPIGQLNQDVNYGQMYTFLGCLQINPCVGWMNSNSTLRDITSERAFQLSEVLRNIAESEKYVNFDVAYMDFPLKQIAETWQKAGGEGWQLIEPVDGFHPGQMAYKTGIAYLATVKATHGLYAALRVASSSMVRECIVDKFLCFPHLQISSAIMARFVWQKIVHEWPQIFGKVNPFNEEIAAVFKDLGGY